MAERGCCNSACSSSISVNVLNSRCICGDAGVAGVSQHRGGRWAGNAAAGSSHVFIDRQDGCDVAAAVAVVWCGPHLGAGKSSVSRRFAQQQQQQQQQQADAASSARTVTSDSENMYL